VDQVATHLLRQEPEHRAKWAVLAEHHSGASLGARAVVHPLGASEVRAELIRLPEVSFKAAVDLRLLGTVPAVGVPEARQDQEPTQAVQAVLAVQATAWCNGLTDGSPDHTDHISL
jgi:hypothetical protein